jgi:hypothetical protein
MKPLSNQQRLHQVNSEQLFENYRTAANHSKVYTYGMRWKTVRGKEYLFKDRDRSGNGKSLGPKSEETEALLANVRDGAAGKSGEEIAPPLRPEAPLANDFALPAASDPSNRVVAPE